MAVHSRGRTLDVVRLAATLATPYEQPERALTLLRSDGVTPARTSTALCNRRNASSSRSNVPTLS
jgi:hypothetical protein